MNSQSGKVLEAKRVGAVAEKGNIRSPNHNGKIKTPIHILVLIHPQR